MEKLVRVAELEVYETFFDLVCTNNLIVARTYESIIAIDLDSNKIKWTIDIAGSDRIGIDFIYKTKEDYFLIFSYDKADRNYHIELYDKKGHLKWNTISSFRPDSKDSLVESDSIIYYTGYSMEDEKAGLFSIQIESGDWNEIISYDINSIVTTLFDKTFIILGSDAIIKFDKTSGIEIIVDNILIEYAKKYNGAVIFISQGKSKGKYDVSKLELNSKIQKCGLIEMENNDRQYMEPFVYNENTLIIYEGKNKGISCYSLLDKKTLWRSGQGKWTCLKVVKIYDKLIIHTENDEDAASLLIYDLEGKCINKIETDVYPEIVHTCQNRLFVSSYDGLEIFKVLETLN